MVLIKFLPQVGAIRTTDDGAGYFPLLRSPILRANENHVAPSEEAPSHGKGPAHWRVLNENVLGAVHM